ncbi:MAG: hypothetical protein ACLPVO_00415 [Desulfomonilaceae bacterium]
MTPPLGLTVTVGKDIFRRGAGLQFSTNRTQEQIIIESVPILIPDVLAKWFPALMSLVTTHPVGPGLKHICRKPKPKENPAKDADGTQYVVERDEHTVVKLLEQDQFDGDGEYQDYKEYDLDEPCPSGMIQVRWKDTAGNVVSSLRRGTLVYEQDSQDFATLQFGLGVLPWIQDVLITSMNPSVYNGTGNIFPFPWNSYDVNLAQRVNLLAYLYWTNPVVRFEVGTLYSSSHAGPELAQTTANRAMFPPTDRWTDEGWLYLEYFNNRINLRTELDWFTRQTNYQPSLNGTFFGFNDHPTPLVISSFTANPTLVPSQTPPGAAHAPGSGSPFGAQYIESLRFMADAKVIFGPAMFELFYSHMPGPDRRHGILINKQPNINTVEQAGLDPFYSVSSLLAFRFGGGVNSPGDLSDASVIAGKIDYSLAANLNVSASYLHAWRVSHGYGWGWIRPSTQLARFGEVDYDPELRSYLAQSTPTPINPFSANVPAIPDSDLGWEVDANMHWRLLEQFGVDITLSYWQPGKWFNYACVDKSVPGWNIPQVGNNWGVNPNRTIDPIMGIAFAMLSSF